MFQSEESAISRGKCFYGLDDIDKGRFLAEARSPETISTTPSNRYRFIL
jgi:hypothetical protein